MSQATLHKKATPADLDRLTYKQPAAAVGEQVIYYQDNNRGEPVPAVVLGVGFSTLTLGAFVRDSWNLQPVPHARHVSDPALDNADVAEGGSWDYSPQTLLLRKLEDRLQTLEELLVGAKK